MTRIVMVLAVTLALTVAAPTPEPSLRSISNSIFRTDISPEEAQQYLNSPPFTAPQLSSKTATLPLVRWDDPRFRAAESGPTNGHYWKNGREIENTKDYEEEVYDAQQFHGQDGLGAYAYGYKAPESSKVENRARSGDVTGAYEFKAGNNELIKVRYWADSQGFHQEDNVPRDLPKPPEEPEDVRQARLAHEKAWQEAAAAAAQHPDPQGEYNPNSQQQHQTFSQYQQSASEQRTVLAAPGSNPFQREGKSFQNYPGPQQLIDPPQGQDNPCSRCDSEQPAQIGPEDKSSEDNPCARCNGPQPAQIEYQQAPNQGRPCSNCGSQMQIQLGQQIRVGQSNQMQVKIGQQLRQLNQQQNPFESQSGPSNQDDNPCLLCNGQQAQPESERDEKSPCLFCSNQLSAQNGPLQGQSSQQQPQFALPQGQQQQRQSRERILNGPSNQDDNPCLLCNDQQAQPESERDDESPCSFCSNQLSAQNGPLQGQSTQQQPQYAIPHGQQQQRQSRQRILNGLQNLSQQRAQGQQSEEPEPTGPPRGFFYSFNYPVSILTRRGGEESGPSGRPGSQGRPGGQQPIDSDTVGVNAQRP